jgi:hypothetical protein
MSVVSVRVLFQQFQSGEVMSKNAKKFQKHQLSKHNQRCSATPDKRRYRDDQEAKRDLRNFRARAAQDLKTKGSTTYNQKRTYLCSGCNGYHLTSQELGRVKFEVVRELTIQDLILSA